MLSDDHILPVLHIAAKTSDDDARTTPTSQRSRCRTGSGSTGDADQIGGPTSPAEAGPHAR